MTTRTKTHFHREHKRVPYVNATVDEWTGELIKPATRVKQSFVAECDINNIVKMFKKSGMVRHMAANAAQGAYMDLPDQADFQLALNTVLQGEQAFASLPSKVRERFHNDPAEFLQFLQDPDNQDEAIKLGLATDTRPPKAENNGGGDRTPPAPPAAAAAAPKPQPSAGTNTEPSK